MVIGEWNIDDGSSNGAHMLLHGREEGFSEIVGV